MWILLGGIIGGVLFGFGFGVGLVFLHSRAMVLGYLLALHHVQDRISQAATRGSGRGTLTNFLYLIDAVHSITPDPEAIRQGRLSGWEPSAKFLEKVRSLAAEDES